MQEISESEKKFIQEAYKYLENPNFLAKTAAMIGNPIEKGIALLPENTQKAIADASTKALNTALKTALFSLGKPPENVPPVPEFSVGLERTKLNRIQHAVATGLTGAAGGFFGLPALPIELPLTTTLILRSTAKIAADFGANLEDRATQMDCLFIFAMGSPEQLGSISGSHYYSARFTFASMMREAVTFLAAKTTQDLAEIMARETAPVVARVLARLAARFQLVVTQKFLAQSVPLTGAITGSAINVMFTEHFNKIAKYHFGLQRLEKIYGEEAVKTHYCSLLS